MTFDQYSYCGLGCCYCTIAGTPISVVGGNKPIEHLMVGDSIYSRNVETMQMEVTEITATMERTVHEIYEIELENGRKLNITGEHPVWVNNSEWKCVKDLKLTDEVDFVEKPYLVARNQEYQFRKNVSKRMKKNNPRWVAGVTERTSKTLKKRYASGELTPYWLGKEKPDAKHRMLTNNPMKDPTIRRKTLQKSVKTWLENGRISIGEKRYGKHYVCSVKTLFMK